MSALACCRHSSGQLANTSLNIVINLRGKRSGLTYILFATPQM
jgi:hypothetical protein